MRACNPSERRPGHHARSVQAGNGTTRHMLSLGSLRVDLQTAKSKSETAPHRPGFERRLVYLQRIVALGRINACRAFAVQLMTVRIVFAGLDRCIELCHCLDEF